MEKKQNKKDTNEEEEVIQDLIILNDADGNPIRFQFLDEEEVDGNTYVLLLPLDGYMDNPDVDGEVVILQENDNEDDDDEEINFTSVDDEKILDKVYGLFKEKFKDEFDFSEFDS